MVRLEILQGQHHFFDTSLYEKSILATWNKLNLPKLPLICLTQSPHTITNQSHSHVQDIEWKILINSSGEINFEKINSFFKHNHHPILYQEQLLLFRTY